MSDLTATKSSLFSPESSFYSFYRGKISHASFLSEFLPLVEQLRSLLGGCKSWLDVERARKIQLSCFVINVDTG